MKKHIALLFLSLGFFTACDMVSGEGEGADNAVYMGNTNSCLLYTSPSPRD